MDLQEKRIVTAKKFEWISIVYLAFFVFAVLTPSIVPHGLFGLDERHVEEALIFFFGIGGIATFLAYDRIVESRLKERDQAVESAERATRELVESYRYIGSINRQIDVLKKHVSQTSIDLTDGKAYWKDILQSLVANAAACANAKSVLLRFVELDRLRTDREVVHHLAGNRTFKVSNRELKQLHDTNMTHAFLSNEEGEELLVVPSDKREAPVKAYLLFSVDEAQAAGIEVSLIKVFANQAELIYHHLVAKNQGVSPLGKLDEVASMSVGDIS